LRIFVVPASRRDFSVARDSEKLPASRRRYNAISYFIFDSAMR
jgi:hypothetical protein